MDILTEKTNKGLHLYFKECGRSVSDFELSDRMVEVLYLQLCNHLFDNLLEQNKDVLMRLKHNKPAPKKLDADKVIAWLRTRHLNDSDIIKHTMPDGSPTSCPHIIKYLSDRFLERFKKDFDL